MLLCLEASLVIHNHEALSRRGPSLTHEQFRSSDVISAEPPLRGCTYNICVTNTLSSDYLGSICSIDIGGSAIKCGIIAVSKAGPRLTKRLNAIVHRSHSFAVLSKTVEKLVTSYVEERRGEPADVAIATTGSVDGSGRVLKAGHFQGYENIDWSSLLLAKCKGLRSVYVVNDGRASTWAEYCGQNASRSLLHVTVGTGVGAGLVSEGRLFLGEHGFAGALGHMKMHSGGEDHSCGCGELGCLESVASASAIVRHYRDAGESGAVYDMTRVLRAARNGDETAASAVSTAGSWLGLGISHAMNLLNPGAVTIGGGVMEATRSLRSNPHGLYIDAAIRSIRTHAHHRVLAKCSVRPGKFGNDGGLLGAAELAVRRIRGL